MDRSDSEPLFPVAADDADNSRECGPGRLTAVQLRENEPICDVDELVCKIVTRSINRYDAAYKADWELDGIMLKRRALDFRLGELLALFKKKKGEDYMGHRSIGTFSVEHLSFSGRLASELMRNSEILSKLPVAKEAYLQGEIKKSALRQLSRVLTPENEAEWIAKAKKLSLKALERAVKKALKDKDSGLEDTVKPAEADCGRADNVSDDADRCSEAGGGIQDSCDGLGISCKAGGGSQESCDGLDTSCKANAQERFDPDIPSEESDEPQKGLMMHLDVSIRLAPVWDFAVEQFRNREQYNGPVSLFVEELLANYITSGKKTGDRRPAPVADSELPVFYRCHMKKPLRYEEPLDDDERQIPAGKSLPGSLEEEESSAARQIIFPPSFHETPDTVEELADKLIELARYRQELDVGMAKILWVIDYWDLYSVLGYSQIEEYGKKKGDLPNSMLYRLMRMADGFRRRPLIEKAFKTGLISKEQARQILRISDEDNERIWIDFAAHSPSVTLKEELERCLRIIDYDCFSRSFYNILPGFRYITDERYGKLPDDIKKAIRTGSWYRDISPEEAWPLDENDEHMLMEHDPRLEEPWRYFEDVDDFLVYEAEASERKKKSGLCASLDCQHEERRQAYMGTDSFSEEEHPNSGKRVSPRGFGKSGLCARLGDQDGESRKSLCASLSCQDGKGRKSLCASLSDQEGESRKSLCASLSCQDGEGRKSLCASHQKCNDDTLSKAREICTMPHGADPAETFVLDILADEVGTLPRSSTMPIRFFLPEELFEMWNTCFGLYLLQPGADDSAQGFIAALLQEWLVTERLHFKVTRNYAILKRDRFRCQVPGCNCRRNLHVHHIIPRSHGGSDEPGNLIVLCEKCHLRLLHDLHTLKIEGTAPFNLTFTFGGARLRRDGIFFLKYLRGRKVLQTGRVKLVQNRSDNEKMTA